MQLNMFAAHVAKLLMSNPRAMEANFFVDLAEELSHYGFKLEANQQGARGTHIQLVRVQR